MTIAAIIIYVVLAFLLGPLWPLQAFGKGGILGAALAIGWAALLIAGLGA